GVTCRKHPQFFEKESTPLKQETNLNARGLKNTRENFADFCCEVGQLLCRSLAITHEKFYKPTSGRFLPQQSTWQNGRVRLGKWTAGCGIGLEGFPIPPLR
ncbi:MAG: hypothetical protein IIU92_02700, partial [Bacteroidaceae bacterium]|nr:hypothetical protein [Bacteroidaceae bacterium]